MNVAKAIIVVMYIAGGIYTVGMYHCFTKSSRSYIALYLFNFLFWPTIWISLMHNSIKEARKQRKNQERIKEK